MSRTSALLSILACIRTGWCIFRRCRRTFVKDPRSVAKPGDVVRVKVLEIDAPRKRIALTMRLDDEARPAAAKSERPGAPRFERATSAAPKAASAKGGAEKPQGGALGDALLAAMRKKV